MGRFKRLRPTYAGVTATAALVVALGMGGAYANTLIGSKHIAPNAVKSKHIKDGHVKTLDIGPGAVTTDRIGAGAVTTDRIAGGAVTGPVIADNSVTGSKIPAGAVTNPLIADNAVTGAKIQAGAVGSEDIADSGVQAFDIDGNAVGGSELKDLFSVFGAGVTLGAGQAGGTFVTCPGNAIALSGGAAWQNDGAASVVYSVPDEGDQRTWVVRGIPSSTNNLFAWARCLPV